MSGSFALCEEAIDGSLILLHSRHTSQTVGTFEIYQNKVDDIDVALFLQS